MFKFGKKNAKGDERAKIPARLLAVSDVQHESDESQTSGPIPLLSLNVKFFGYSLAQRLATALPPRTDLKPRYVGLASKPTTQEDMESEWVAYWLGQLKIAVVFHRKLWEYVYVLQAVYENGFLRDGLSGVGFGCGLEPLPSFFASLGMKVIVTDLPPKAQVATGWAMTNQHLGLLENAFHADMVGREMFDANVSLRWVDMNAIPDDLGEHDFCWSICALEHLGSIANGLKFIENSLGILRPGGLAVHTTEFNFLNDDQTLDNCGTVLFQRKHFQELHDRLRQEGHSIAPLDFDIGSRPMDRFIDIPPYVHDWPGHMQQQWGNIHNHLKLSVGGFASTCFGIIIRKKE